MRIRKHISILLAVLLLVSNVGLAFNVHYCGGEIASVSLKNPFFNQNTEDSCCGVVEKKSNCCNDKVLKFDKKSDNSIVKLVSFQIDTPFVFQEWKPIVFGEKPVFENRRIVSYTCNANAPPIFKRNCQLIFYA
ncbi:HYC_CC_PP family protein [Flavobacterium sp.]|uniref:HYC_CC_PP family protein n=1 Tax=Flavobacterium sp. TaxID=239 RepID=UPI0038FCD7FE